MEYPETPDGRYFVSRGRLWRKTDPRLDDTTRRAAIKRLMQARRDIGRIGDGDDPSEARARVDAAKRELGERGPVWWDDGAPDEGGRAPWNSSYAEWWHALPEAIKDAGTGGKTG
ncbi:hypothetical protein E2L08_08850 [Palleronia sediminis]|uniref:Uncharacterized protein n=1 Tax=Palleronia sediminis TaxID=2547833 RepID=A0A4R6AA22_9RHOB|nr:hypothetical protein [Palleronia sediminis]TDL79702.1 hypothetical protein E2L08_08850 [Palleronia sediminis]